MDAPIGTLARLIEKAYETITPFIHRTPMEHSTTLSTLSGAEVFLKLENLQKTGSFKIRGATYAIARLQQKGFRGGVVAASAGNHAQGVAYAASQFGFPATIVMPVHASLAKVEATKGYGAAVELVGQDFGEAYAYAQALAAKNTLRFIPAFDDLAVIAGQGSVGLEILEQLPDVDAIVVATGGGGLIAGITAAVKAHRPEVLVYGVQAQDADAMVRSYQTGHLMKGGVATIADGIAVDQPGRLPFAVIRRYVDGFVTVTDEQIATAMLLLLERCKQVVEAAGAAPLAALLSGELPLKGKRVALVLSGGNVDVVFLQHVLEYALQSEGRYWRTQVILTDRPGSLATLLMLVASTGANLLSIEHHREGRRSAVSRIEVELALETSGPAHIAQLKQLLQQEGYILSEAESSNAAPHQ